MSFSEPVYILLHLAGFAFLISLAFSGFMISAGLIDKPVDRSNHSTQVPTAGGVGIVAGIGAALLALTIFYPSFGDQSLLGAVSALILGIAFLGLIDDIYDLRPLLKFLVMVIVASAAVNIIGPPTLLPFSLVDVHLAYGVGFAGAVLWIFVAMNGVNFMDGANGLMSGFMGIAFAALALIGFLANATNTAILASIFAAGLLGFMPYNWRNRAFIFAGDVGALTAGFGFAVCSLLLISETGNSGLVYIGPMILLPFLTDILITLLMRARKKENLLSAHSSHAYQRLVRAGFSHVKVAIIYMVCAIGAGIAAYVGFKTELSRSIFYLALQTCFWVMLYLYVIGKYPSVSGRQQTRPDP